MRIIKTHETKTGDLDAQEKEWAYNGLDCAVTSEVLDALLPQLDTNTSETYAFSRALQGPSLEMRLRGVLVDSARKAEVIDGYRSRIDRLEAQLQRIVIEGIGLDDFNWRAPAHQRLLFYDTLRIPPVRRGGKITTDRAARDKLAEYLIARPLVAHINRMSDLAKKISVLNTEIDPDDRIRTSYNIAGTSTGRFSSSLSEFGTGGNLQNVEESLRSIFISDPGYKFAKFDAKSGESYCVGAIEWNLFNDGRYLDAVESGDIHTAVAKLTWHHLGWTGDATTDRNIAERDFHRHLSYRDMCKKLGHGSNYAGQPKRLHEETTVPIPLIAEFQRSYFDAFPAHLRWHEHVRDELYRHGFLISLTGRKRWFLGRRDDPATLREAIAYDPQCSLADLVNRAMLRIWRDTKGAGRLMRQIQLMMHDHDALTFQYPEHLEDTIIPILHQAMIEPLTLAHGRTLAIPYDCVTGWNRGKYNAQANPNGLRDYTGHDKRQRQAPPGIMDRIIRRAYRGSRLA